MTTFRSRIDELELGPFDVGTRKAVRAAAGFVLDMVAGVFEEVVPRQVRPLLPFVDQALDVAKARVLRELDEFLGGDGDPTDEEESNDSSACALELPAPPRPPPPPQPSKPRSLTVEQARQAALDKARK